jgi:hypothetical protein
MGDKFNSWVGSRDFARTSKILQSHEYSVADRRAFYECRGKEALF